MDQKFFLRTITLGAGLWLLASGAFAQSVSLETLMDFAKKVENAMGQLDHMNDRATKVYEGAMAHSSTPKDPAYAAVSQALVGLKVPSETLDGDAARVEATKEKIKTLFGASRILQSNDARWKDLQGLIKELQDGGKAVQKDLAALNPALQEYNKQISKAGIWMENTERVDRQVSEQTEKVGKLREKVKAAGEMKLKGHNQELYQDMKGLLGKAEESLANTKDIASNFKKSPAAKEEYLYGGPGIQPNLVVQEMEKEGKNLNHDYKKFKKKWIKIAGKGIWKDDDQNGDDGSDKDDEGDKDGN